MSDNEAKGTKDMDHLPPATQEDSSDLTHKELLVATIESVMDWRQRKAEEFAENQVAYAKAQGVVRALEELADFVLSLPEDDDLFRVTSRAMSSSRRVDGTYSLTKDALTNLGRYGIESDVVLSEEDHRRCLRRTAGIEQNRREEKVGDRSRRQLELIQSALRDLRRIQVGVGVGLGDEIERELDRILGENRRIGEDDPVPVPPYKS